LPVTFVVWYFAAPVLTWPAALIVELVARTAFADLVQGIEQVRAVLTFATTLKPGSTSTQAALITVDVDLMLYSFGLPLYAALVLAAKEPGWVRRLVLGYAVLMPFVAWGALADFLKTSPSRSGRRSRRRRDSSPGSATRSRLPINSAR
jgi:predicted ABC-type sugar transport system permease subunit